jgi:hypothetical protein
MLRSWGTGYMKHEESALKVVQVRDLILFTGVGKGPIQEGI